MRTACLQPDRAPHLVMDLATFSFVEAGERRSARAAGVGKKHVVLAIVACGAGLPSGFSLDNMIRNLKAAGWLADNYRQPRHSTAASVLVRNEVGSPSKKAEPEANLAFQVIPKRQEKGSIADVERDPSADGASS
ncbi:ATP-binding protein [Streptomyces sp. NPDC007164]|uniref:ATP-binding protein n=1 Tax=Streptomyces sp. NPDC007164 TaxID=3156918 RepID=UPI0033FCCAE1